MTFITRLATKLICEKQRWRAYKARVNNLPEPYRGAVAALERYLMISGGIADGDSAASLLENLADLFEQSVADGTSIREIVGDNPVEFIEEFLRNYAQADWRSQERQKLIDAIDLAAGDRP